MDGYGAYWLVILSMTMGMNMGIPPKFTAGWNGLDAYEHVVAVSLSMIFEALSNAGDGAITERRR